MLTMIVPHGKRQIKGDWSQAGSVMTPERKQELFKNRADRTERSKFHVS